MAEEFDLLQQQQQQKRLRKYQLAAPFCQYEFDAMMVHVSVLMPWDELNVYNDCDCVIASMK